MADTEHQQENAGSVEDSGTPSPEPSYFDKKDARSVFGKILSTNLAVMAGGMNGRDPYL